MPNPRPGESKEAFVSRYMASEEARKDFPDEKQRAAVAYSTWGEGEKSNNFCPDCGAEMKGDADKVACIACGREIRKPAPIANLGDTCPSCFHSKAELHDSIGCKAENCGCSNAAALPNADDDKTLRRLNEDFKRKHNVDVGKTVSARGKSGKVIDFGGNEVRVQWDGGGADWVQVSELKNSGLDTAQERWEWSDRSNRFTDLTKAGIPDSLAAKCVLLDWSALDLDVRDAYSAKFERNNAASQAAFEAHTANCAGCANALETGKPEAMCAEGQKLIEAKNISAGAEYAKKHGIKHPKDLPFDQPNEHGCNGCDAVKVPLNADGYCKECATQQGAFEFTNGAALCGGCGKQFEGGTETFQEGRPEGQLCPECKAKETKNEDENGPVAAVRGSMGGDKLPYLSNDFKAAEGARLYGSGRA